MNGPLVTWSMLTGGSGNGDVPSQHPYQTSAAAKPWPGKLDTTRRESSHKFRELGVLENLKGYGFSYRCDKVDHTSM